MEGKYGGNTQEYVREKLRGLRPRHDGKLTPEAWGNYMGHFKVLYQRMDNPSEDEAWA